MRLTRLELSGFKSFAGTVELPFEAGVTAIVGPNGCGKSNISDAVRWVLGEQSPRLLRGGKMEDVIFQGSTGRRPVNLAEVSLVFDNGDGSLPLAYQEVVVTRRLSRSGQSEYLLNRQPVRLRDIQDLLRGTGLGADAAVVMEARMIDALLSEKAEERRSLFEEAAGIGIYRDRKRSTERRLEETAADLARLEDLIAEVQTQVRSLARQRGRAERYSKMIEERFGIAITLVRRGLEDLDLALGALGVKSAELATAVPAARERLAEAERDREARVQGRHTAEARRTEVERRLADAKLEVNRLEGDLALAAERLHNAGQRRAKASQDRSHAEVRAVQSEREHAAADAERTAAERDLAAVQAELGGRTALEQQVRERLVVERTAVRGLEEDLQRRAEALRALEGERTALERERAELRQQLGQAAGERAARESGARATAAQARTLAERAATEAGAAAQAAQALERARRRVAELKEQEAHGRSARRRTEEALAQLTARRDALAELARERVGLAPAAQALLKAKARFGDAVVGPLADFVRSSRRDAELAERLLGEWLHAVVVRDESASSAIRAWYEEATPGPLVLLPCVPGPRLAADGHPLKDALRVDGAAAAWVQALLAGYEVLDGGKALRRANGAVFLDGGGGGGPLQRRAELESLEQEVDDARASETRAAEELERTLAELAAAEAAFLAAATGAERARQAELEAGSQKGDAERGAAHAQREAARTQAAELRQEIAASEHDAAALDAQRAQWEDQLKERRLALAALEAAAVDAEEQVRGAEAELVRAERARDTAREALEAVGQEEHHLELERTGIEGRRRALAERVAVEWRKPLDRLLVEAPDVSGDVAWLRQENERLQASIEAVGPGECDVRLGNEDDPLESEIEIHAAPRGKRTQRIHLLSSGERTLVAVSLLFAIFLARPSPFCVLDEVDAPLDDANVGRYVRLLSEFKDQTQFIVITHNPRTMQAADAVYGVTMQEPGVSTIVGVRLGQLEPA